MLALRFGVTTQVDMFNGVQLMQEVSAAMGEPDADFDSLLAERLTVSTSRSEFSESSAKSSRVVSGTVSPRSR